MTTEELKIYLLAEYSEICYSGGAEGADYLFGEWATDNNFAVVHFSFKNHKHVVNPDTVLELPYTMLTTTEVISQLKKANASLNRKIPRPGSYVYNLLARNSFQILVTERGYCIAPLASPSQVQGGTAWAVQMYIDANPNVEIYCYDPTDKTVYEYINGEFKATQSIPRPSGRWTGIGSRNAKKVDMVDMATYFKG